jgi:hypothetical protein
MTIRNEALISRYFDRQMSPSEEQNFLISLAASNELRLAFRGQLELMKAIRDDKHEMRPIGEVRSRTLATLGLSAAATAPFLEHALINNGSAAAKAAAAQAPPRSFFNRLAGKLVLTGSSLVAGFLAAGLFFGLHEASPVQHIGQTPTVQTSVQQANPTAASSSNIEKNSGVTERQTVHSILPERPKVRHSSVANTNGSEGNPVNVAKPSSTERVPGGAVIHTLVDSTDPK